MEWREMEVDRNQILEVLVHQGLDKTSLFTKEQAHQGLGKTSLFIKEQAQKGLDKTSVFTKELTKWCWVWFTCTRNS